MSLKIGQVVNLDYAKIHWFQLENSRTKEDFGDPLADLDADYERDNKGKVVVNVTPPKGVDSRIWREALVQRLIDGWDVSQGATKVEEATKDQVAKAIADRKRQIAVWQEAKMFPLVETAKKVWFHNGKAIEPVAIANETFRRAYAIMGAIHRRIAEGMDATYNVPAMVVTFDDEKERRIDHLAENLKKDDGRKLLGDSTLLAETAKLHKLGGLIEADLLRAGIKKGTAQRLLRTCELSAKYHKVHKGPTIVDRCLMDVPELKGGKVPYKMDGYLSSPSLAKEAIWFLYNEKNPFQAKQGSGVKMEDAEDYPFTVDNVEKYLRSTLEGGVNAQKQMSSTRIAAYAKNDGCKLVQYIMQAIVAGDDKGQKMLNKLLQDEKLCAKLDKVFGE